MEKKSSISNLPNSSNLPISVLNDNEQQIDLLSKQYTGRVTKNIGIKKYNQRMLKEIGNVHAQQSRKSPVKQSTSGYANLSNQNDNNESIINNRRSEIEMAKVSPYKLKN